MLRRQKHALSESTTTFACTLLRWGGQSHGRVAGWVKYSCAFLGTQGAWLFFIGCATGKICDRRDRTVLYVLNFEVPFLPPQVWPSWGTRCPQTLERSWAISGSTCPMQWWALDICHWWISSFFLPSWVKEWLPEWLGLRSASRFGSFKKGAWEKGKRSICLKLSEIDLGCDKFAHPSCDVQNDSSNFPQICDRFA